ncbi:unnamed protein product [Linum trigynum]|uniref:GRF-type domain-containing protein n=1 Tax=Linum trigynum TaxID=586398 RepID=A0AAV2EBC6_9ROSI
MEAPFCRCGLASDLKKSWTKANPGRRFYGCSKYGTDGACNFFRWHDPVVDEHMKFVVLNFHRRIRELEKRQNGQGSKANGCPVFIFIVISLVFSFIWMGLGM